MSNLTQPLNTEETEDEQTFEHRVPARGLEGAYGDDEPEYTLDMLITANPDYKGTDKKCGAASPVPARGLEGAYGDDEPEYTLDMLIAINPDYEGTNEKCGAASPVPARQLEKTCSEKEPECKIEGKTNEGA